MRLLAILLFGASTAFAQAAPFIVSDPDPTGASDKCVYQVGTAPAVETNTVITPPALTGACKIDTVAFPIGVTNMQVWFKSSVWGVTSGKVPFVLQKPSASGPGPSNLRLAP